jgi:radical SAM protein with 4Fe4S-binding SPASM domain
MDRENAAKRGEPTFRLIITEDCNASCPHCFNANLRVGKHMPMDIFYRALSCVDAPAIKIMGGEPTLHPDFIEIVDACHQTAPVLRMFTNGLKKEILDQANWQPNDTVAYNFFVANKKLTNQNYLWEQNINRTFHVVVNTKTDLAMLFTKLRNLAELLQKQPEPVRKRSGVALSLDTQENIFFHKERLQEILHAFVRRLRLWGFRNILRDHPVPVCFWTRPDIRQYLDTHMDNNKIADCLSPNCASWIGIDGTIRHCNQFPIYCGELTENPTRAMLDELYLKGRAAKLALIRQDEDCGKCPHLESCLGGCFKAYHMDRKVSLHRLKCA